jgi:hypothetical protein
MTTYELESRSGASFYLSHGRSGRVFVKYIEGPRHERLLKQIKKQQSFKGYIANNGWAIKSPRVTSIVSNEMSTTVEMDYVDGYSAAKVFSHLGLEVQAMVHKCLSEWIRSVCGNAKPRKIHVKSWQQKVEEVDRYANNNTEKKAVSSVCDCLAVKDIITLGDTCHGDLTFSNLVINPGDKTIWVFDFLDTYDDSPIMDLSKLFQELVLGWSTRHLINQSSRTSAAVSNQLFWKYYDNIVDDYSLRPALEVNNILTLLRILPYIRDNNDRTWITTSLTQCLDK